MSPRWRRPHISRPQGRVGAYVLDSGCSPLVESWPDSAGAITRPEWTAPYAPGTELVATGTGEATGNGVAAVGLRTIDGYYSFGTTITSDETTDTQLILNDAGDVSNDIGVGWAGAIPGWYGGAAGAEMASGATGATNAVLVQWNATDWSITIGAEAPITGTFPGALVGPLGVLIIIGGANGANLVDELTVGCEALA